MENANVYSIQIDSGYYDVNKVSDVQGYDAGLVSFEKGSISGIVWKDSDYDGLMQESEDVLKILH